MKRTVLMLLIGAMVVGLVAPSVASAQRNDIDQDADAWAGGGELIENEADVDVEGEDFAFASANCQLTVLADAWVTVIASADNLAVITDEDDVEFAGARAASTKPAHDFAAETAQADCTESVGPVDITVLTAEGFGEKSPQGSAADILTALNFNFGNARNDVSQDAEAGAELDDAIENEYSLDADIEHGAVAASNCQAIVGAHIGVLVAAVGSNTGEIEDSDSFSFTERDDEAGASRVDYSKDLTVKNDHNATSSCSMPFDSIKIFVGPAGSSRVPSES